MKRTLILLFIITAIAGAGLKGQTLTSNIGKVTDGYNFWLYTPDSSIEKEDEPKPVIIFLHGASLCGKDLNRVKRYGTIDAIQKGLKPDAYVIAPQNPGGSWNPKKIMNILDWVGDNHNIDYDRIYVIGMSLGGFGTIDMCATYPDQIAAAMAFCGGGTATNLGDLNEVPLWIVHGTADRAVSVSQSDKVVSKMREAAGGDTPRLIYDRIPGMNHSEPARLFYRPECYEWLLRHSLKDNGRYSAEAFEITNALLRNAYRQLRTNSRREISSKPAASNNLPQGLMQ